MSSTAESKDWPAGERAEANGRDNHARETENGAGSGNGEWSRVVDGRDNATSKDATMMMRRNPLLLV